MQIEDIKPIAKIEKTNAQVNDPGITFNESGVTFNDSRYTFGGVGKDGEYRVFSIVGQANDNKPK
jgi:hypothetical protein